MGTPIWSETITHLISLVCPIMNCALQNSELLLLSVSRVMQKELYTMSVTGMTLREVGQ